MGLLHNTTTVTAPAIEAIAPLDDVEEIPVPSFQFSILMGAAPDSPDVAVALFQKCSGLSISRETTGITEGGKNDATHELPGHVSYGHVTLEVGLSSTDFFYKWMMDGRFDGWAQARDFTLIQRRPDPTAAGTPYYQEPVRSWDFKNAYPVKWKISSLDVTDSKKIVIETLELTFDYFEPSATP
ncbi:MAG: phage tail protein [Anaerolineaceae bacterium]|nr:phage tail protein [Anaerolineaceae bacterium]